VSQPYEFRISLRIWHPSMMPAEISRNLRIRPCLTQSVGAARKTPKGQLLGGEYRRSYWTADITSRWLRSARKPADSYITRVSERLAVHARFLRRVHREGGRAEIWVWTHSKRNYAIDLPPGTLKRILTVRMRKPLTADCRRRAGTPAPEAERWADR